jgi:putative endonuclease
VNGGAFPYILRCADGKYYVGTTRKILKSGSASTTRPPQRLHGDGRPVTLVFAQHFDTITDAVEAERRVKGWSRAKKEAMINSEWNRLSELARRRTPHAQQSKE